MEGRVRRSLGWNAAFWAGAIAALLLCGCAKIGVTPYPMDLRLKQLSATAFNTGSPSERTMLVLKQRDMAASWRSDIRSAILVLDADYRAEPERETLFALMELCYVGARMQASNSHEQAAFQLTCAVYAHDFLFDPDLEPRPSLFDPASRQACEFYNRSLAALMLNYRARHFKVAEGTRLPLINGVLELTGRKSELAWTPSEYDNFFVSYEFKVKGLDEEYGSSGLGVPMITQRTPPQDGARQAWERYLPKIRQTFPATVYLRIAPGFQTGATGGKVRKAGIELYDPVKTSEILVEGRHVPLETDLTTPLAYMMEVNSPPQGLIGLLKPEEWNESQGLHMLQPYEKDKIPVVFVHGLMSSPITWLPMLNNLMGDPRLRERYQFWFFMYPTGNPVLYSASLLRGSLDEARSIFDPAGNDPAFNKMVVVGHSMGGLLSRTLIQDSGSVLWDEISKTPPEDLGLDPKEAALIRDVFFFSPKPYVSRVIFMATPHRGSSLATSPIGAFGAYLVTLPFNLVKSAFSIVGKIGRTDEAGAASRMAAKLGRLPTGIDGLSPDNPALIAGSRFPMMRPFHSIIGDNVKAGKTDGTDGIVPYASSHMDGARSEVVVYSGHSVQDRQPSIREVRRILLEHAGLGNGERETAAAPAQQAATP